MQFAVPVALRVFNTLSRLSACLWTRFQQTGNIQDIDWTIALQRLMIDTCPHDFPDRRSFLENLATFRTVRYERWRRGTDLDRAIVLGRDALSLCPRDHEDRPDLLEGLASSLWTRFKLRGKLEDLDELIGLMRASLGLLSEDHPGRPTSLGILATRLLARFQEWVVPKTWMNRLRFSAPSSLYILRVTTIVPQYSATLLHL